MKLSITLFSLLFTQVLISTTHAALLVDYRGGEAVDKLGNAELEGNNLGCKIDNGKAGFAAFIKPEKNPKTNRDALHFHRDPNFRRAEVKALGGKIQAGKTYYIGYEFGLSAKGESLVIFQWKKHDKNAAPKQNIPIYVFFNKGGDLTIEYTIPGTNGSNREVVWTGPVDVSKDSNKLGFVINTTSNGKGWLEFYVNGKKQTFNAKWGGKDRLSNVSLFTGPTSPKFGIYRAERQGGGPEFCPKDRIFKGKQAAAGASRSYDSWIYRVQISDSSLKEIAEASGIQG